MVVRSRWHFDSDRFARNDEELFAENAPRERNGPVKRNDRGELRQARARRVGKEARDESLDLVIRLSPSSSDKCESGR